MAKSVTFKKKPLKTEETEQKLDQWLDQKTKPEAPPAHQNGNEEQVAAQETAPDTIQQKTPDTAEIKTEPAKAKPEKKPVSFEKQEEDIEIAQVTFHMPKSLQRRLKFECFRQDTTIKDYVIRLLDKQLPKDAR